MTALPATPSLFRTAALPLVLGALLIGSCTPLDAPNSSPGADVGVTVRTDGGVGASADPVIVAAGDIVCGNNTSSGAPCKHALTANLVGTINPQAVLLLGDNQYEDGTFAEYNALYGPTWGQYKSITFPSVGNHEYHTANASGYFDYFNGVGVQTGRAGARSKGYYSFDLGAWHLVALNSNCGAVGGCGAGSAQEVWLKADLLANPKSCTLAYWHHPRFSSGVHGDDASTQALWQALYAAKADVILTGHDHNYERFAPMTATGVLDNTNGIRSFVVGTGGKEQRSMGSIKANSVVRSNNSFGVLKLTLHTTGYDWQFVAIPGDPQNDAGSSSCVGLPQGNQNPVAAISAPSAGASFVQGAPVAFAGSGTDAEDGALGGNSLQWTSNRDGAIGTGSSFTRSNLSAGSHIITLTVTDAQGATGTATRTFTVTPPVANQPPTANFTATCTGQQNPLQCAFDASSSTDDNSIVTWAWNWGNGRPVETKSANTARNTFAAPATYQVTLTVTDGSGLTGSITKAVVVGTPANQNPTASISAPTNGASFTQGTVVAFSGSGSDPESGSLSGPALVWKSDRDGTLGTGASFSRNNLTVGAHVITLTASDPQGLAGTATRNITITAAPPVNQPPVANFTANCVGQSNPKQCLFDATTSTDDGGIVSWTWNWGNGRPAEFKTSPTARNTFATSGTWMVTLTVRDAAGLTASLTKAVTVP